MVNYVKMGVFNIYVGFELKNMEVVRIFLLNILIDEIIVED